MMKKNYIAPATECIQVNMSSMVCASVRLSVWDEGDPETDDDGAVWIGSRSNKLWDDEEED